MPCGGVQSRHRTQQPGRVGHPAVAVKLFDVGDLDRTSGVHDHRPVGELRHHTQVVGDDQHAGAGDVARCAQHVEDLRLHGDVQRGGRLVADQQVRIVGDRDRDHHPLALAAGQLVRESLCPALRLRDADQLEQLDGSLTGAPPG